MQPFINPNYYQQIMPMNQVQTSRFVNNFNDIMANDVPMDGKWVLFGKSDMSEVCAKSWTPQGTIATLEYSLKQTQKSEEPKVVPQMDLKGEFEPILAEIKALNEKIDKLSKQQYPKTTKKEVHDNES